LFSPDAYTNIVACGGWLAAFLALLFAAAGPAATIAIPRQSKPQNKGNFGARVRIVSMTITPLDFGFDLELSPAFRVSRPTQGPAVRSSPRWRLLASSPHPPASFTPIRDVAQQEQKRNAKKDPARGALGKAQAEMPASRVRATLMSWSVVSPARAKHPSRHRP
jgi:hypothetical protein